MKKSIVLTIMVITFTTYLYFVNSAFIKYSKQTFYYKTQTLLNMFEYKVLSGDITVDNNTKYVTLNDAKLEKNVSNIDYNNSYIVFKEVNGKKIYYLTAIGIDKYKNYIYKNVDSNELADLSNIIENEEINVNELINNINAQKYEVE